MTTAGGISGFGSSAVTLATSGVHSSLTGSWSIAPSGNTLNLVYAASAIPEPGTYAALALAARKRRPLSSMA